MSVPEWVLTLPIDLIYRISSAYGLDFVLVCSIVMQESGGSSDAARYEKHYKYLENPKMYAKMHKISEDTEVILQKTSFSLTQIMGGTARWMGYKGPLNHLFKPSLNLEWGCTYLKYLRERHSSTMDVIAAYNAGSVRKDSNGRYVNQEYVDSVMAHYRQLTVLRPAKKKSP